VRYTYYRLAHHLPQRHELPPFELPAGERIVAVLADGAFLVEVAHREDDAN
jgi:hypothetical protein